VRQLRQCRFHGGPAAHGTAGAQGLPALGFGRELEEDRRGGWEREDAGEGNKNLESLLNRSHLSYKSRGFQVGAFAGVG
jgi:hypothetical protein